METPNPTPETKKTPLIDIESLKRACSYKVRTQIAAVQHRIQRLESSVESYARSYNESYRDLCSALRSKKSLESAEAGLENLATIEKHLSGLIEAGKYASIGFENDFIVGVTSPIFITHESKRYEMGSYKMRIGFEGSVEIRSMPGAPKSKNNYCHPHVNGSGRPCLGNIQAEVPKIIERGDYGVIMEIMHDYLSSYNAQGPYEAIGSFSLVKKTFLQAASEKKAVAAPVRRSPPPADEGPEIAVSQEPNIMGGRFMALAARQSSRPTLRNPNTVQSTPAQAIASATGVVISERVDRDLRSQGVNPASLNIRERRKLQVLTLTPGVSYHRRLRYYVTWLSRNGRSR